jgi:hypothetical protein
VCTFIVCLRRRIASEQCASILHSAERHSSSTATPEGNTDTMTSDAGNRIGLALTVAGFSILGLLTLPLRFFYRQFNVQLDEVGFSFWDLLAAPVWVFAILTGLILSLVLPATFAQLVVQEFRLKTTQEVVTRKIETLLSLVASTILPIMLIVLGARSEPNVPNFYFAAVGAAGWSYLAYWLPGQRKLSQIEEGVRPDYHLDYVENASTGTRLVAYLGLRSVAAVAMAAIICVPIVLTLAADLYLTDESESAFREGLGSDYPTWLAGLRWAHGPVGTGVCFLGASEEAHELLRLTLSGAATDATEAANSDPNRWPDVDWLPALLLGSPSVTATLAVVVDPDAVDEEQELTVLRVPSESVLIRHRMGNDLPTDC